MRKQKTVLKPEAARECTTIGEVERLAGIGQTHAERFAFWRQFSHLGDGAFAAARAELYRRIEGRPDIPTLPENHHVQDHFGNRLSNNA
ncbi:hypothetical protein G6L97_27035 (plasmid) [Agrobacterium tumefaciens]|uniref:hypothetical protein n=1 Tax=Agrobacterium tumefaciens TaxID=358 RepID=UPI00157334E7|nr:hypothetical protein [Agrobacterium tumefaciens]WCA73021.1 hypothetical protein G6L97_27035 [Agrobacterium tumefaciens]